MWNRERSIQFEDNQIEKPSTKDLTAWLLSKLHVIRQLKYRLKMITQTERFQASSCKHCKTAMLVEKNLASFLAWEFEGKVLLFSLLEKNLSILW